MKLMTIIAAVGLLASASWAADVDWKHNYDDALKQAKTEKKLVVVDVYADWCGWCKKLDKDVYTDKDVQAKISKSFVPVKINPEKSAVNARVAQNFGVRSLPHILFLDADGKKISEIIGYVPAGDFLKALEQVSPTPAAK